MHSFVSSRLDNFNGLLYGVPKELIGKLQRIQNAAARVISGTKKHDHVTPVLIQLHWLPIAQRIEYKILLLTFKAIHDIAPLYIQELVKVAKQDRTLRSNDQLILVQPSFKYVTYGERCFSYSAPHLWNKLPTACRMAKTVDCFKSHLKTHLFRQAFNV